MAKIFKADFLKMAKMQIGPFGSEPSTCDLNRHGVKGHLGVNDLWFKFLEKRVSISTYFDVFSNLILQWLQKYVIAKAGETRGSRTALLRNALQVVQAYMLK